MALKSLVGAGLEAAPEEKKKKEKKKVPWGSLTGLPPLGMRCGDKGDVVLGVVANLSDISAGPLPRREVGQPPPTRSASLRRCGPPPISLLSALISH